VSSHIDEFKHQIGLALSAAGGAPFMINCHSGLDSWSYAESLEFFTAAVEYTKSIAVPVYHETHRGRALYNPWICRDIVLALPDIQLTADYSHWYAQCRQRGL
jgi:hypothetical protein